MLPISDQPLHQPAELGDDLMYDWDILLNIAYEKVTQKSYIQADQTIFGSTDDDGMQLTR